MQRISYSAGLTPDEFWNSTFDEVLLFIQGRVDEWRIQRVNAWKIVEGFRGSEGMPELYNFYPLPYDFELIEAEKKQQENDIELYKQAVGNFDNVIWMNNGK